MKSSIHCKNTGLAIVEVQLKKDTEIPVAQNNFDWPKTFQQRFSAWLAVRERRYQRIPTARLVSWACLLCDLNGIRYNRWGEKGSHFIHWFKQSTSTDNNLLFVNPTDSLITIKCNGISLTLPW